MKRILFIFLLIFFAFLPSETNAAGMEARFFSSNQSNIIWEVGFRIISSYDPERPARWVTHSTVYRDWVTGTYPNLSWCQGWNRCSRTNLSNLPGRPGYAIQYGTACLDPNAQAFQDTQSGDYKWRVSANITTYNRDADLAWFSNNGGGRLEFGGFYNTRNCPTIPIPNPPTGRSATTSCTSLNSSKINFEWNPIAHDSYYEFRYRRSNPQGNWINDRVGNGTGNDGKIHHTVTGLADNTWYDWQVKGHTTGSWPGPTDWSQIETVKSANKNACETRDLDITFFRFPGGPDTETSDARVTIRNIGNTEINRDFYVRVDNKQNRTGDSQRWQVRQTVSPRESISHTFNNMARPPAGDYIALAEVDSGRDIAESDETNNTARDPYTTTAPAGTYSLSGGVFIDTDPVGQRNGELYTNPLNPERILINNRNLNTYANSRFDATGFYVPGLSAGAYDVEFPTPIRQNYVVSFHPERYRVTVGPNGVNLDFGISQTTQQASWFQGVGGYMRSDAGSSVTIPAGQYFSITSPALLSPGVIFNFNVNRKSTKNWFVSSPFREGISKMSYTYISDALRKGRATQHNLFGAGAQCGGGVSPNCFLDNPPGGYFYTNNRDIVIKKAVFRSNSKYVFLIDGDLTIDINDPNNNDKAPWVVPPGTSVLFIAKGNIIIDPNVTHIEGVFSADGDFIVNSKDPADDSQLIIEGSVIANAKRDSANTKPFDNKRDLGDSNNTTPSVKIIYRPDFVLNAPPLIRYSNYNFHEVAPQGQ